MDWLTKQLSKVLSKVSSWIDSARKSQRRLEMFCFYYKYNSSEAAKQKVVAELESLREDLQHAIVDIDNSISKLEANNG